MEERYMSQNEQENIFYAEEDRRNNPKEYFQVMSSLIGKQKWQSLCDIGCATGDFLHYIRLQHGKEKRLAGVDNFDKLRDIAASRLPDCKFYKGDIWTKEGLPEEKFDVVCMAGVLCLFEDFRRPLRNLMDMVNEKGIIMIFSPFNSHDCHTEVYYKQKGQEGRLVLYSLEEIGKWIENENKEYSYRFIPFRIGTTIEEQKENPIRSYTVALADGTNGLINGIDMWLEQYLLVITK